ncbi:MAG TPA: NUDIX domain-containing protein [Candidatus Hydrogenedentes bacterium]|nr:NUDIX domain-containing protein [Candidatus Hydrogenedentota bacterium]HOL77344.1 NUDIX domain-containing protein [Candidatus Hydrogenedentota bacterium]HPO84838.1 NUDIX domain-containing protein [Candidatus Hydrogenedentota bacterium]
MHDAKPPFQWKYCPQCGNLLKMCFDGENQRPFCETCVRFYYFNPVPATCCFVLKGDELLLVQRAIEPCRGQWTLPGGFMELGETAEEGALRELYEETNIVGRRLRLVGTNTQNSKYSGTVIILAYYVEEWDGIPRPHSDALQLGFFAPNERPPLAFQAHRELLAAFDSGFKR